MAISTWVMLLDYCGGLRTDALVEQLKAWNPGRSIHVLDNASPSHRSSVVTHQNAINSYTGGGLRDCIAHATASGASHLLFIVNDVSFRTALLVQEFERVVERSPNVVQVSATVTPEAAQASPFPWMVEQEGHGVRITGHADLLVSLLDLHFVESFGGFPDSRGGWGYSWELAYQASCHNRDIVVLDGCVVGHSGDPQAGVGPLVRSLKSQEATTVYRRKYGTIPWQGLRAGLQAAWAARAGGRT